MGIATIAASSALVLGACGGGGNAPEGHQAAPPPQSAPGNSGGAAAGTSCVSSNQVLSNAQSYTGKPVTITGTVTQLLGQHAFTVTPSSNSNGGILGNNNSNNNSTNAQPVLAVDKDATQLTQGSPVEVTGTLQPTFDPNHAATFTGGSLGQDPAAFNQFNGKPYVQAAFAGPISTNLTHGTQGNGILPGGNNTSGNNTSSNCAAISDVLSNTQSYTGQQVTVTGTVAQVVSPHAVTIAATGNNSGNNAQTLLAVAKDNVPLTPGAPIEVTGMLQPTFDANQASTFTGTNLGKDQAAFNQFNGKPYVQAAYAGPASANLTGNPNGS